MLELTVILDTAGDSTAMSADASGIIGSRSACTEREIRRGTGVAVTAATGKDVVDNLSSMESSIISACWPSEGSVEDGKAG